MGRTVPGQMDIFDFIERMPGTESMAETGIPVETALQRLFGRLGSPAVKCRNCLCQYCADNAEELYRKVKPGEMQEPCFSCDGCWEYTHEPGSRSLLTEDCSRFRISDYGAARARRRFRDIKKGEKDAESNVDGD